MLVEKTEAGSIHLDKDGYYQGSRSGAKHGGNGTDRGNKTRRRDLQAVRDWLRRGVSHAEAPPEARRLIDLMYRDPVEITVAERKYVMSDEEARVSRRYEVFLGRELEAEVPVKVGENTWRLDVYDPLMQHAIESKARVGSQAIQNAIGELLLKPQRLDASRPVVAKAILFGYGKGKTVYHDVAEDLLALGICIIQEQADGSFMDNAGGAFTS